MLTFSRSLPEETGISTDSICRFVHRLQKHQIPMHSFLLWHRGSLINESYYAPVKQNTLHRMFSITKSLTCIAIGLLEEEHRLQLDDPVIQYFPEKLPKKVHPFIASMTIRDMLMMRTCHAKTTYRFDMTTDWVASFFTTEPSHPAGTVFHYDTSAAHVLCALAEKLSGMDMLDFLKNRLAVLGLSEESYLLKDPFGVSLGGSGLVATSMDLLRFGYFLYNEGNIDGKQLLSREFIRMATSFLTSTAVPAPHPSEALGYGMQIWRTEHDGFVCYGMGGQLIIVIPDKELICVTTADTQGIGGGNGQIYDALYEEILANIDRQADMEVPLPSQQVFLKSLSLLVPSGDSYFKKQADISGKRYLLEQDSGFTELELTFQENSGCLRFVYQGAEYSIPFGMGRYVTGRFPMYSFYYAGAAVWLKDGTLYLKCNIIDSSVGSVHFQFHFTKDRITVFMRKQEESLLNEFNRHLYGHRI